MEFLVASPNQCIFFPFFLIVGPSFWPVVPLEHQLLIVVHCEVIFESDITAEGDAQEHLNKSECEQSSYLQQGNFNGLNCCGQGSA